MFGRTLEVQPLKAVRRKIRRFEVKKSVVGVPAHAYRAGCVETSDLQLIAVLRRLPDDHVKEIGAAPAPEQTAPAIPAVEIESPPVIPELPNVEDLNWRTLCDIGLRLKLYTVGMTKLKLRKAIREYQDSAEVAELIAALELDEAR